MSLLLVVWNSKSHKSTAELKSNHIVQLWNFRTPGQLLCFGKFAKNVCRQGPPISFFPVPSIPKFGKFRVATKNITTQKEI